MNLLAMAVHAETVSQQPAAAEYRVHSPAPAVFRTVSLPEGPEVWEVQLVRRIALGEHEAFGELYDRYSKPLYSLAVRILNDKVEAQDVLQEVFLTVWRKSASFDGVLGRPFSWAAMITRNKAIDRLRVLRRLRLIEDPTSGELEDEVASDSGADECARRELSDRLRAEVNKLPSDQRTPIELAFYSGLTHVEIAGILGAPLGTIKARIRRALELLRGSPAERI